jgi:polysaccharide biosynthesis protein PslG
MMRRAALILGLIVIGLGLAAYWQRAALHQQLFDLTGEEGWLQQTRAVGQLAGDLIRPRLDLQPETPIAYNGVNPFGINTFLQQEVEPAKRQRQVELIAAAGFHWLRQEFPWYDIEISGKGNFQDCRNPPKCISAWDKYDQIVALAQSHNLELLVRLSSPPDWSRADGSARGAFGPPDNMADYADYAAAVATRYKGRVKYYQIWNEPNIYDQWGKQPVDPEAYTRLLCATYQRLKQVDPNIVVVSAALAATAELGAPLESGGNNLNDAIFLQRMYAAGAAGCFDVLSVQGYGLFSGPTDHRLRPLIVNYGRNQLIRDVMVTNGDAHKAIWISEMNWNAVPPESGIAPVFGQVSLDQQAQYVPLAYQRAQADWPWIGVNAYWYFKDADDSARTQPVYYFRMADPDFNLLPVYNTLSNYMHQTPVMYPGWFQEDDWAVTWTQDWQTVSDPTAVLGAQKVAQAPGAGASFVFDGTELVLVTRRGPQAGRLSVSIDQGPAQTYDLNAAADQPGIKLTVARSLAPGPHQAAITSLAGRNAIDGFIVRNAPNLTTPLFLGLAATIGLAYIVIRRRLP